MQDKTIKNSAELLSKPLNVGGVEVRNRAFLAPMSGVTDLPFRKLAWRHGAGLVVSEMVASQSFIEGEAEMQLKAISGDLPVHVVQIAGCEAHWMERAAVMAEANGASIIDINMGCPAKRVVNGYSGSALMRDPGHALKLVEAVVRAVNVPVTLKMRLGWDHDSVNAPEIACRAEQAGVQMITVHGRTRCQFYKGEADWNAVSDVKAAISIPLAVNGDIVSVSMAALALEQSGADAVMTGRGAYGAPWLPALMAGAVDDAEAVRLSHDIDAVVEHHEAMLSFYGMEAGIRQARKHLGWYMDQLHLAPSARILRGKILKSLRPQEIHAALREIYSVKGPAGTGEAAVAA